MWAANIGHSIRMLCRAAVLLSALNALEASVELSIKVEVALTRHLDEPWTSC